MVEYGELQFRMTSPKLAEQLSNFFDDFAQTHQSAQTISLSAWLPEFFTRYASYRSELPRSPEPQAAVSASELAAFLSDIASPLAEARQGAFQFDPWKVVDLGRDEVRNVSVLTWLLNPQGRHGMELAPMKGLLAMVDRRLETSSGGGFAVEPGQFCRVRAEINPSGEIADRVDIEIDAENFYLIIEAKIDALEQINQLERYCRQAAARAGKRQWLVVFLTPFGLKPKSAGQYENSDKILPLSWRELATGLERAINKPAATPITGIAPSRLAAEFSARCFLKKLHSF
jgi:hypothetical protein